MSHLKFTLFLKDASRQITEGIIRRPLFPLNVRTVTITELHRALDSHVSDLKKEMEKAKDVKEKLSSLQMAEESLINNLLKIDSLKILYENFWEEDIPSNLREKKNVIVQLYDQDFELFRKEADFRDFLDIKRESDLKKQYIEELDREAQKLIRHFKELFEDIERYFRSSSKFITRLRESVVPKLEKSNKTKIEEILTELYDLYENTLVWIENAINQVLKENVLTLDVPKTRTTILEEERNLREVLIKEIKDLDEESVLILLEIVKVLALHRAQWLSVIEVCRMVAEKTHKDVEVIKKILFDIAEKGFLTLAIGF
jgi:hypothetical protein